MILSAHCTAAATMASVLGLTRLSKRSSVLLRCRATRIPAPNQPAFLIGFTWVTVLARIFGSVCVFTSDRLNVSKL